VNDFTASAPLNVLAANATLIQRVPPVMNFNFPPDMGRMTGRLLCSGLHFRRCCCRLRGGRRWQSGSARYDAIGSDQLGPLISTVHRALAVLGKPPTEVNDKRIPAVPIRRSVHRDYVVCLECGWRGLTLRRHLSSRHGLSVDQYRARWSLSREHPITAPSYSERRSGLAKELGLGRGRRSPEKVEAVVPETPPAPQQRSRRPRRPRSPTTTT
jgi:predicted transcriptional regulator